MSEPSEEIKRRISVILGTVPDGVDYAEVNISEIPGEPDSVVFFDLVDGKLVKRVKSNENPPQ